MNWRDVTTLGIGASEIELYEPQNESELRTLCANQKNFFILGNGSNLLGSDSLKKTDVLRLCSPYFSQINFSNDRFNVFAGCKLSTLATFGIKKGFNASIELAGIPATMGGALRMNASAHGVHISDHLLQLRGYRLDGREETFLKQDISWGYRHCSLPSDFIIVEALFDFEKIEPVEGMNRLKDVHAFRLEKQGMGRSAGCVFKNPEGFSAGTLIDACHLKGYRIGGAQVSPVHANFLLNVDHATELDFLNLIKEVTNIVKREKKIELKTEIIQISKEYKHELRTH